VSSTGAGIYARSLLPEAGPFSSQAPGSNLTGLDPETGALVALFHPRRDVWEAHFALRDALIVGLTPTGRTTVRVLTMNTAGRAQLRRELQDDPPVQPH
jgi:hypothetical protein